MEQWSDGARDPSPAPLAAPVRRVLDAADVPVATLDGEGHLLTVNPTFARACGRGAAELLGMHVMSLCPGGDQADLLAELVHLISGTSEVERHDLRVVSGDGRVRVLRLTLGALPGPDGRVEQILAVAEDVTEQRRGDQRRRREALDEVRRATADAGTGLPNERALHDLVASAGRRSARTGAPFALLHCRVSLDDSASPPPGDGVLRVCAERLAQRLRAADTVTRLGDGGFGVVAEDLSDTQDAAGVAYRLLSSTIEPLTLGDLEVPVTMTVGVAVTLGEADAAGMVDTAAGAVADALADGGGGFRIRPVEGRPVVGTEPGAIG